MDIAKRKVSRMVECTNIKANVAKCGYVCNGTGPPGVHSTLFSESPGLLITFSMPLSCPVFSTDGLLSDELWALLSCLHPELALLPCQNYDSNAFNLFFEFYVRVLAFLHSHPTLKLNSSYRSLSEPNTNPSFTSLDLEMEISYFR